MTRLKVVELTSAVGALVLGIGFGALVADWFAGPAPGTFGRADCRGHEHADYARALMRYRYPVRRLITVALAVSANWSAGANHQRASGKPCPSVLFSNWNSTSSNIRMDTPGTGRSVTLA